MPRRVNLIPMAGAGKRYADAGYSIPKPLIPVDGKPMIVRAAECLPDADEWIFVCRQEHIDSHGIDRQLQRLFSPASVVSVDHLTEGQASTCLLARDLLRDNDILTIGPCDNAMTYSRGQFDSLMADDSVDVLIWTFRNNPAVLQDPTMYGWVKVDDNGRVTGISVKIPISKDPVNDHAVIGAFTFKRAADFIRSVDDMIAANRRIKSEFYVDEAIAVAVEAGLRVRVFEVQHYVCWGTPADLKEFERRLVESTGVARGQDLS